jgi:hypothetical protein
MPIRPRSLPERHELKARLKIGAQGDTEQEMNIKEAQTIVQILAQGVDPTTGEIFGPDSPYNEPRIIRALFTVNEFAGRVKRPTMSVDEKRRENLELGRPRNYCLPWTDEARAQVAAGFEDGKTVEELATMCERTRGAIRAELIRQGLVSPDFHFD